MWIATGFERSQESSGNAHVSTAGEVKTEACLAPGACLEPDLQTIIDALHALPEEARAKVLEMFHALGHVG
jgi:hypothetical protein